MQLDIQPIDEITLIKILESRLDILVSKEFRVEYIRLYEEGHRYFIVDLENVEFLDTSGVGSLLGLYKTVGSAGTLCICHIQPRVEEILKMLNMKNLLNTSNNVEEAKEFIYKKMEHQQAKN